METILLAVTVVSLLVALIMSAAAWRISREERARSAARVAALAAASARAEFDASYGETSPKRPQMQSREGGAASGPVAQVAPEAAPAPVAAPARVAAAAPVATPARVSVFAAPRPVAPAVELSLYPSPVADELPPLRVASAFARAESDASDGETSPKRLARQSREGGAIADTFLGGGVAREHTGGGQRGLMVAAAALFVLLGGGAYWLISGDSLTSESASAAVPASISPLELVSLGHDRHGARLSLSGLVRNPSAGAAVEDLTAVVFLFDAQGGFVSSARAGVDFKRLGAGDESPFVVTMDAPSNVARYRVSFRNDAGIVAHVDRRNEQPLAATVVR